MNNSNYLWIPIGIFIILEVILIILMLDYNFKYIFPLVWNSAIIFELVIIKVELEEILGED